MIHDFNNNSYSDRHGLYGGKCRKAGAVINGENWIVKYPHVVRPESQSGERLRSASPLSEYLSSRIFRILGVPAQEVLLGVRNNELVVACKDFCSDKERLLEFQMLKNAAHREIAESGVWLDHYPGDHSKDDLDEVQFHLRMNPVSRHILNASERFWDMVVIDILLGNSDRCNSDWGVVGEKDNYRIAPVFGNGKALVSDVPDAELSRRLSSPGFDEEVVDFRSSFSRNGKVLSVKGLLSQDISELKQAVLRNVPKMIEKMGRMKDLIESIPEQYHGLLVCSDVRKDYFVRAIDARIDHLLVPMHER